MDPYAYDSEIPEHAAIAPPPGLGFSTQKSEIYLDDPNRERHIQELIHFYQFYDPDRQNIESHVIDLFNKNKFKYIARAVLLKYGVLPSGWSEEYDARLDL